MSDGIGCVLERGPDVIEREAWIGIEQVVLGRPLGQLPEQQLDGDQAYRSPIER